MKNILLLIAILLVGACATTPTVKSVVGTYEHIEDGVTGRMVFLENGVLESYLNGKKQYEYKWTMSIDGELHFEDEIGGVGVLRINKDGSIKLIAIIEKGGKRQVLSEDEGPFYKKIK